MFQVFGDGCFTGFQLVVKRSNLLAVMSQQIILSLLKEVFSVEFRYLICARAYTKKQFSPYIHFIFVRNHLPKEVISPKKKTKLLATWLQMEMQKKKHSHYAHFVCWREKKRSNKHFSAFHFRFVNYGNWMNANGYPVSVKWCGSNGAMHMKQWRRVKIRRVRIKCQNENGILYTKTQ